MNVIVKVRILIARNKKTQEIIRAIVLGDEDSSDRVISLQYDVSLFSFEQLQTAVADFSEYTKRQLASSYMMKENFILEQEAWDMPSIGDFEVVILENTVDLSNDL